MCIYKLTMTTFERKTTSSKWQQTKIREVYVTSTWKYQLESKKELDFWRSLGRVVQKNGKITRYCPDGLKKSVDSFEFVCWKSDIEKIAGYREREILKGFYDMRTIECIQSDSDHVVLRFYDIDDESNFFDYDLVTKTICG